MAARAIWKGRIHFGDVRVPVKLYSAVEDRTVHFRLLHEPDRVPLRQRMVNPETGEPVPRGETRRGYELEDDRFVMLDPEELEELRPEKSREIEITRFVPPGAISHQWYDRPYFLGPDGSAEDYAALREALESREREGVARWVMRNREYVGALRRAGERLMLITLRKAGEVVPASALEAPEGRELDPGEIEMAEQLIGALEDEFEPAAFRDEHRERVMELIEAKAEGRAVEFEEYRPQPGEESLAEGLKKSIERAREEKVA